MLSILERKEEKKKMNIYAFMNSIPDNVSNPLTAINVMIMISSLKEKFGDKIHETTYEGYLAIQDISPYKYYKLYLWYWCDECTYGIRECTAKDFNIKEEDEMDISKMTKEDALKAIENLKAYVEKCEEKEKEIPEMPHRGDYNVHMLVHETSRNLHLICDRSFENPESADLYNILAFELANLIYARDYLKVDGKKLLRVRKHGDMVFKVIFDVTECRYEVTDVFNSQMINESDRIWCFTDEKDALRVCDYMNKYVKDIKKCMY